jgi:hypothetical protein
MLFLSNASSKIISLYLEIFVCHGSVYETTIVVFKAKMMQVLKLGFVVNVGNKIPSPLWDPPAHCRVRESPPLIATLN